MRSWLLLLLLAGASCRSNRSAGVDAAASDPAACPSLNACQCLERADCVPVTESCWCPTCGGPTCFCGGGRFWGCAPVGSVCPGTVECPGKAAPRGPDERGCFACGT